MTLWTVKVSLCRETLGGEEGEHTQAGQTEEAGVGARVWVGIERIPYSRKDTKVDCVVRMLGPMEIYNFEGRGKYGRKDMTQPFNPGRESRQKGFTSRSRPRWAWTVCAASRAACGRWAWCCHWCSRRRHRSVALGLYDVDVEGGFGGGVCGPALGDRNFGLGVWCGGRAGGRGTGVEEALVCVWLGGEGGALCVAASA